MVKRFLRFSPSTLDFDPNPNYEIVTLQLNSNSQTSHHKRANQILMAYRYALKSPHMIGQDRARFTVQHYLLVHVFFFEIKIYKAQGMQLKHHLLLVSCFYN